MFSAVLWDFGGVVLSSPFDAFSSYEDELGLPRELIRTVNATNPHTNAWAKLERSEVSVSEFGRLFEAEAAEISSHPAVAQLSGRRIVELLAGDIRPQMVTALRHCKAAGLAVACLTNNMSTGAAVDIERQSKVDDVMALFDVVVESAKVGVRKPEPRFYEIACELLQVTPEQCVFLDDLGINLKPAKAMGMTTIKVGNPDVALSEL